MVELLVVCYTLDLVFPYRLVTSLGPFVPVLFSLSLLLTRLAFLASFLCDLLSYLL